jgi:membrane protein
VGTDVAVAIEGLIQRASEPNRSRVATFVSIALLFFGATGVFAELKDSLDIVWDVKRKPGIGLWTIARTQLLAFAVVIGTGFLLLVSLLLTTILTGFLHWLGQWLPGTLHTAYVLDILISFLVITFLFALIFKLLPDVTIHWRDVGIGSVVTAVLFMLGKSLIGLYIAGASVGSIYGAAGSLVVILVWTYYSSQILFFGAELIRAYAHRCDPRPIVPTSIAVPMSDAELIRQGMPDAAHKNQVPGEADSNYRN